MNKVRHLVYSMLAFGSLSASMIHTAYSADATVTGTTKVKLTHVFASLQNGSQDKNPADIAACKKQVSEPNSKYLGIIVVGKYSINPSTLIMSASATLPSPQSTQPLELTIPLKPLGIAGQYAFGAFRPAELPNTYVLYSLNLQFKSPTNTILVLNEGKNYNCVVSSDAKPFGSKLKSKYGADQS